MSIFDKSYEKMKAYYERKNEHKRAARLTKKLEKEIESRDKDSNR